jgi:putative FmdB family regulatory protein
MPYYEYTCLDCKHEFEIIESLARHDTHHKVVCPGCSSDHVERKWSTVSVETSRKS